MRNLTTIACRSILFFTVLVPATAAAEPVTLDALFAAIDADPALRTASLDLADAEREAAPLETRLSGPGLDLGSRVIFDGESEFELAVTQGFPLGGARRARHDARVATSKAMVAESDERLSDVRHRVATLFYEAVHRQRRAEVLHGRETQLGAARDALKRREESGDASAFEVERMAREVRQVTLRLQREQLALAATLDVIAELVPDVEVSAVDGALAPRTCTTDATANPSIRAHEARIEAAEHSTTAAKAGNAVELETHAGWAAVVGSGEFAQGFVAGIGLRIPFWGYGSFAHNRADAEKDAAAAERELAVRELAAARTANSSRCAKLVELAAQAVESVSLTAKLVVRAEAGYAAGELSLLELVDAQRALLEDRLEHLELLAEAREAELEMRRVTGDWP